MSREYRMTRTLYGKEIVAVLTCLDEGIKEKIMLTFDESKATTETLTLDGRSVTFRAYRNLIYVSHPVEPEFQQMNLYIPEAYYHGKSVGVYTAQTAPIFMPNTVGGYMPGPLDEPGYTTWGPKHTNAIFEGLLHGYVVAAAAVRGRTQKDANGENIGKAPAFLVDMKAAVRFVRWLGNRIPGDREKIITNGKAWAAAMDWGAYIQDITRMKNAPAFDAVDCLSPENDEFGSRNTDARHFTAYSHKNSLVSGDMAPEPVIRMLNPMPYLTDDAAKAAPHWRIRHGSCDRDTSLAISAILTLKLKNCGCPVDYHLPWGLPHSGDYDLPELFAWIDEICRE